VVLGAAGVGKTSVVKALLGPPHSFPKKYAMTTGVDIFAKQIRTNSSSIILSSISNNNSSNSDLNNHHSQLQDNNQHYVELFVYDFSGKQVYRELVRKLWAQNVSLIVGVFDVNNEDSFVELQSQLTELLKQLKSPEETAGILLGNKTDLTDVNGRRVVSSDEAHQLAKRYKMRFFDVSARDGRSDIEEAFTHLATSWYEARLTKQ